MFPRRETPTIRREVIQVEVRFTGPVVVNTSGGLPTIALELGPGDPGEGDTGKTRRAQYTANDSGGARLIFVYTVQAEDLDDDGIVWVIADSLVVPPGSSMEDTAGERSRSILGCKLGQRFQGGMAVSHPLQHPHLFHLSLH